MLVWFIYSWKGSRTNRTGWPCVCASAFLPENKISETHGGLCALTEASLGAIVVWDAHNSCNHDEATEDAIRISLPQLTAYSIPDFETDGVQSVGPDPISRGGGLYSQGRKGGNSARVIDAGNRS